MQFGPSSGLTILTSGLPIIQPFCFFPTCALRNTRANNIRLDEKHAFAREFNTSQTGGARDLAAAKHLFLLSFQPWKTNPAALFSRPGGALAAQLQYVPDDRECKLARSSIPRVGAVVGTYSWQRAWCLYQRGGFDRLSGRLSRPRACACVPSGT